MRKVYFKMKNFVGAYNKSASKIHIDHVLMWLFMALNVYLTNTATLYWMKNSFLLYFSLVEEEPEKKSSCKYVVLECCLLLQVL